MLVFLNSFWAFPFVFFFLLFFLGGLGLIFVGLKLVGSVESSGITTEVQTTVLGFFMNLKNANFSQNAILYLEEI